MTADSAKIMRRKTNFIVRFGSAKIIGKSSLAATAGYRYQSADAEPIFLSGFPGEIFQSIIASIAVQTLGRSKSENTKNQESTFIKFRGLKRSSGYEIDTVGCEKML